MTEKIKGFINARKEVIFYLFFGVLTTLVNFLAFYGFSFLLGDGLYLVTNIIAWVIAVIFAYITNKLFVFESRSFSARVMLREIPEFLGARVFSLLVEEAGLWLLVGVLGMGAFSLDLGIFNISGQLIAKAILAVIVVILNYFFSKFIIFAKEK